ncbi:flagellar type III secretion system pore protein FliP [Paracoccus litorisediminis]|jgi:flagellar biosynthetic protein FliP|uniref:Flagellar biosynthetic protein FliP n=1 Tax=Paracoccus litorisediminis TaxID=2006130 RepID=A0A844HGR2_9RHOB|nr:flagellar type III secretion system pore protein FliP [Paracoccus litorisediminis]MTH59020.1 flagellar type III secretion system pore protein FliP [Paracoccus litorisediminis]
MTRLLLLTIAVLLPQVGIAQETAPWGEVAQAAGNGVGRHTITILAAMTALSLAPGIAIMVTCFPFIATVLSVLRQSIGLSQAPPNMVIVSLAMFLTWFVMSPVLTEAWNVAGAPLRDNKITIEQAFERGIVPFRNFMEARADPETLEMLAELSPEPKGDVARLSVLVPAFMLTEIQRAFEIGFLVSLPFLIIDLVVSAVLMSMGMMMVPPAVVALPFKLAFFVVVDGWQLVATALVRSYQ